MNIVATISLSQTPMSCSIVNGSEPSLTNDFQVCQMKTTELDGNG